MLGFGKPATGTVGPFGASRSNRSLSSRILKRLGAWRHADDFRCYNASRSCSSGFDADYRLEQVRLHINPMNYKTKHGFATTVRKPFRNEIRVKSLEQPLDGGYL
jgi:hypothetical protein